MIPVNGRIFVRIAGISGSLAVALCAYGAHEFRGKDKPEQLVHVFETANRYHFMTSLALLATPLARRPYLVGTLLTAGMTVFSGSCYYHAITDDPTFQRVTPFGGTMLIVGFATFAL